MDQAVKKKWVKALRSGRYKKTTHALRDATGYCVIGVLCHVLNPKGWKRDEFGDWTWGTKDDRESGGLPETTRKALKIRPSTECKLIELNDGVCSYGSDGDYGGKSFEELADYIEKKL